MTLLDAAKVHGLRHIFTDWEGATAGYGNAKKPHT